MKKNTGTEKNIVKVQFEVILKSLANANTSEGKEVFIEWKRGAKKSNKGKTRLVKVQKGVALWNEQAIIKATLVHYEKLKKFDNKALDLSLKEVHPLYPRGRK